ncbi:MAG: sigma-54-dependent Fis family transcriptional regulator [Rhodobacteraceae bacterium]|nr:sigma-54-dependent Fis family transcriptional regulator [Paracoccaceae bacterium]
MAHEILVVDDEADIRELIAGILDDEGFATRTARDSDSAINSINERRPSLVILDIWLQGSRLDGLGVLDAIQETDPDLPVVIISGHGNVETAVSAIKRGAYDYIEKPFKTDRLIHIVERALEASTLKREIKVLKKQSGNSSTIVGESTAANHLRQNILKVATANSRILISGPSGSGKELAARMIHDLSPRSKNTFVVLNAATMTPDRMEEELFGIEDENGNLRKVGALEEAHGGTLYLDEVGDMPRETQGKILRVLVEQSFTRVGGTGKVQVDVRVISSTGRDLEEQIRNEKFREDLYHRLSVVPLRVPGLAERREDVPVLVRHFMEQISAASGIPSRIIGDDAMAVLQTHDWPGNIRQLRNNVERLLILARGEPDSEITADMLPAEVGSMVPNLPSNGGGEHLMAMPLREARENFEREYLKAQIQRFDGNISRTSEFVGMERSALHRKLKSLGLS